MKTTLVSHFYNEEFLLPYWLQHHKKIVDHGILIDYDSTDRSVEIINEICPEWEIRQSTQKKFDALKTDQQVMAVEREVTGWKMVLNTTEFVFHHDLRGYLENDFLGEFQGLRAKAVCMTDPPDLADEPVDDRPLYLQRHFGHFENTIPRSRGRIIHNQADGRYQVGRHGTALSTYDTDDIYMLWFGFCPFTHVIQRKLQIQTRIPETDKVAGLGREHIVAGEEGLRELLAVEQRSMGDLLNDPNYVKVLKNVRVTLWPNVEVSRRMKELLDD